jgi:citrate synthase
MAEFDTFSPEVKKMVKHLGRLAMSHDVIDNSLYEKLGVKRGLRDINGKGVVCGLTEISEIIASTTDAAGNSVPIKGQLYYRGYQIENLVEGFLSENRQGFEETAYLLLTGNLPNKDELESFCAILRDLRSLPKTFLRDIIMKATSDDIMNVLSRCVLALYPYDMRPDDTSVDNVMRQTLQLIARFPLLSVYSYHAHKYYTDNKSLIIHNPDAKLSTAQNILSMLRPDRGFTPLEARVLDLCLVLHAEHGGGNNSTFTMHVVTSGGTDTYSAVAAALGSLKGYRHGGANIKVHYMFEDMKSSLKTINDGTVSDYLMQLLDKQAFDRSGLIYGMGHAIYSLSDPRAEILKKYVKELAQEKDLEDEYMLYEKVERLAPEIISSRRKMYKGVSANIDFYSGLLYSMLGIPSELFTPLFAIARITGWGAHRIEEISNNGKIIRPGYIAVAPRMNYVPLSQRKSE